MVLVTEYKSSNKYQHLLTKKKLAIDTKVGSWRFTQCSPGVITTSKINIALNL